ncbi:MAG TPA: phospholipid scramblase-related protein [Acidimicrobiales bacterium]|jgi:uncharacterized protein YxjI
MSQQGYSGGPGYPPQQQYQQPQPPQQPQQPAQHPPGWFPDPFGRHETRWWDGQQWTEHVASHGRQGVDPPTGGGNVPTVNRAQEKIVRDVQKVGGAVSPAGGGSIFTEPLLVVNQKAKIFEYNNEYAIYDQHGQQIGAVRQVGQSMAKKVIRVMGKYDQFMTHKLQIVDTQGNVLLALTRPRALLKSKVIVQDAMGNEIGQIAIQLRLGKARFNLESGGRQWGTIMTEDWKGWNYSIQDHTSAEIARITKTWEGFAKAMFTTADNYVVQMHRPLEEPLRSLVIASALSIDLTLKQYNG